MFNFCVLSGRVCSKPDLSFTEEGAPITSFYLALSVVGRIEVLTYKRMAAIAAKTLRMGDHVVVAGPLSLYSTPVGEKRWRNEATLLAQDVKIVQGDHLVLEEGYP